PVEYKMEYVQTIQVISFMLLKKIGSIIVYNHSTIA
ncbi:unnamed protein product, partial [marine sediment metagenome]